MHIATSCQNRPMRISAPYDDFCARADWLENATADSGNVEIANGNDPPFPVKSAVILAGFRPAGKLYSVKWEHRMSKLDFTAYML
jgi:hypothetical protein